MVTSDAADDSPREISFAVPRSVLAMHNALRRHLPCAGERSPFPFSAWLVHFLGSSSTQILQDRGQLGSTGMFRNGREKNSTRSIRQHTIETAIKRAQIHAPDTVVASVDTQGGKLTGLDGCLFGANGGFHPRRVENRLLALLRASTT